MPKTKANRFNTSIKLSKVVVALRQIRKRNTFIEIRLISELMQCAPAGSRTRKYHGLLKAVSGLPIESARVKRQSEIAKHGRFAVYLSGIASN